MDSLPLVEDRVEYPGVASTGLVNRFRLEFYSCLGSRADALFELADAVATAPAPVR
jgi:hypothetical protein